jgi:hypothetical protein
MSKSTAWREVVEAHPQCVDFVVSLWMIAKTRTAPLWVESNVDIVHEATLSSFPTTTAQQPVRVTAKTVLSQSERSECVTVLAKSLSLTSLVVSKIKATKASDHWTW